MPAGRRQRGEAPPEGAAQVHLLAQPLSESASNWTLVQPDGGRGAPGLQVLDVAGGDVVGWVGVQPQIAVVGVAETLSGSVVFGLGWAAGRVPAVFTQHDP